MRGIIRLNMHSAQTRWLLNCSLQTLHPLAGLIFWRLMLPKRTADSLWHRVQRQVPHLWPAQMLVSTMRLHTLQMWKLLVGKSTAASILLPCSTSMSMVCAIVLASYRRGNSAKT